MAKDASIQQSEVNVLRPEDLGVNKLAFTISHKTDEVAVFKITFPSINPSDSSLVNYHSYETFIYSSTGVATKTISIINRTLLGGLKSNSGTIGNNYYVNLGDGFGIPLNHYYPSTSKLNVTSGQICFGKQKAFGEDLTDEVCFGFEMYLKRKDQLKEVPADIINNSEWQYIVKKKAEPGGSGQSH